MRKRTQERQQKHDTSANAREHMRKTRTRIVHKKPYAKSARGNPRKERAHKCTRVQTAYATYVGTRVRKRAPKTRANVTPSASKRHTGDTCETYANTQQNAGETHREPCAQSSPTKNRRVMTRARKRWYKYVQKWKQEAHHRARARKICERKHT